jgi:hypothetical protein
LRPVPQGAPQAAAAPAVSPNLGFPSSKRIAQTQAPIYAGFLVAGIILGVLLATAWPPYRKEVPSAAGAAAGTASSTSTSTAPETTPTQSPISVIDQGAGPSVTLSRLNIARPTWVVVYVSREGRPGSALGARLFSASDKTGKIGLLRSTEPGQTYFVGLSVDNGDRAFSLTKDKPLADADGGPLWATFRAL